MQNCVSSPFSRLNLTYLIIKSQKRNILICQMIHNKHRKLSILFAHSHHFCLMKNLFPIQNSSEIVFFYVFMFEFKVFSNKITKNETFAFAKRFTMNFVNCPLLLAHLRHFCLIKILFPFQNFCKILFLQLFHVSI